jgi:hypothetical protein
MKSYEYILSKQTEWAFNRNIQLIGSKGNRGKLAYTLRLEDNLFEPLSKKTIAEFKAGDGKELFSDFNDPAKMKGYNQKLWI